MARHTFNNFGDHPFRDGLMEQFILPAVDWYMSPKIDPYLLPQLSGSNWECALAVEGILRILHSNYDISRSVKSVMETRCFETMRWLIDRATYDEGSGGYHWDGVTWDTAICARVMISSERYFSSQWSDHERERIRVVKKGIVRWLVYSCANWDRDARYKAGPADLGQVLNTLVIVWRDDPKAIGEAEASICDIAEEGIIERIVRILMAMEKTISVKRGDENIELSYWFDSFNTSEVIEGLWGYIEYCGLNGTTLKAHSVREALYKAIQYIENDQVDGTWGGVSDTCGTLFGYLRVTRQVSGISALDPIVFKALRWMCDENQSLDDGSFLHTSYITVFYLSALIEAYEGWDLARRPCLEVYDLAFWSASESQTPERSKRLRLQLEVEDLRASLTTLHTRATRRNRIRLVSVIIVTQMLLAFIIFLIQGALTISLNIVDPNSAWTQIGVVIAFITLVTTALIWALEKISPVFSSKERQFSLRDVLGRSTINSADQSREKVCIDKDTARSHL